QQMRRIELADGARRERQVPNLGHYIHPVESTAVHVDVSLWLDVPAPQVHSQFPAVRNLRGVDNLRCSIALEASCRPAIAELEALFLPRELNAVSQLAHPVRGVALECGKPLRERLARRGRALICEVYELWR